MQRFVTTSTICEVLHLAQCVRFPPGWPWEAVAFLHMMHFLLETFTIPGFLQLAQKFAEFPGKSKLGVFF